MRQECKCAVCGCWIGPPCAYHIDHIVALARGGANEVANLQLLCPRCNLKKGAR